LQDFQPFDNFSFTRHEKLSGFAENFTKYFVLPPPFSSPSKKGNENEKNHTISLLNNRLENWISFFFFSVEKVLKARK
jgi:hypothetical protein